MAKGSHPMLKGALLLFVCALSSLSTDAFASVTAPRPISQDAPSLSGAAKDDAAPALMEGAQSGSEGQLKQSIAFCGRAEDARLRLECFENIARSNGIDVKPATGSYGGETSVVNQSYTWTHKTDLDAKTPFAIAALDTSDVISSDNVSKDDKAELAIRCMGGKTALYLTFNHPIPNVKLHVAVSTSLSGNQSLSYMTPGSSGKSTGLWNSEDAITFASYLLKVPDVQFHIILPDNRYIGAKFTLAGMKAAISDVRNSCGW